VKKIKRNMWSVLVIMALLSPASLVAVSEGSEAPSVMFRTLENEMVFSRDFVGEPRILKPEEPRVNLVLIFFRTSDSQLNDWMPLLLSELQRLNKSKFRAFLVAVDENPDEIRSFQNNHRLAVPVLLDKFGAASELFGMADISAFNKAPALVLIDKTGNVLYFNSHFSSMDISDLLMKTASLY